MLPLFNVVVILFVIALVAGCRVAVMVVEGGEVESVGSSTCAEGTICIVAVNDTNFSETFTAVPKTGWYFVSNGMDSSSPYHFGVDAPEWQVETQPFRG